MKYEAFTEEQLEEKEREALEAHLLDDGIYDFEIMGTSETKSNKGNDMFVLNINVFDSAGVGRSIKAWALPQMPKQWKHLHDACGLMELYKSGETKADDLIGKTGKCMVIKDKYTNKDGLEIPTNRIDDYVKRDNLVKPVDAIGSDNIPF